MARQYTEDYKLEAAKLVVETSASARQVAKELGLGQSTLEKWVRAYRQSLKGAEVTVNEREELRRLKAEVHKLKLERELLKKAAVFFATEQTS